MNAGALLTDLYELTMLEAYFADGMNEHAVFELFVRRLPDERNFLLAAGLAQVVDYLAGLAFTPDDLPWLGSTGRFDRRFLDSLAEFRFTGDVDAMSEGTAVFADEPMLRISAPLREAQFVESRVMLRPGAVSGSRSSARWRTRTSRRIPTKYARSRPSCARDLPTRSC